MSKIHVSNHLQEMGQFLKQSEKLRTVLNNMDDLDKVDRNDLYELVYSKKSIEKWLKTDIENNDIRASLEELLESINLVLKTLSDDTLKQIVNRNIHDGKKVEEVNKIKYSNKRQYKGLVDKTTLIAERSKSILQMYLLRRLSAIIILLVIYLLTASGKLYNIAEEFENITLNVVESTFSSETTDNKEVLEIVQDSELHGDSNKSSSPLIAALSGMISLIALIMFYSTTLKIAIDLLYIAMPMFRTLFNKFVSEDARKLVELQAYEPVQQIHQVIDYKDKFEVAKALLNNISNYLDEIQRFNSMYNTNKKSYEKIDEQVQELKNVIKGIKEKVKHGSIITKVEALVDAELIYLDNKENIDNSMNTEEDIYKNYKDKNLAQNILRI